MKDCGVLSKVVRSKGITVVIVSTPTMASQIVRHIRDGGECIVKVIPHGHVTVTYPRAVERVRQDAAGEWWFGVTLWAFQWFQFPSQGLSWTLVANECETPQSWPAAKNLPAGVKDRCVPVRAGDASSEGPANGSQRSNCEDAASDQGHSV